MSNLTLLRNLRLFTVIFPLLLGARAVFAETISINLHNTTPVVQDDHTLAVDEIAGIVPVGNWNNIGFVGGLDGNDPTGLVSVSDSTGTAAAMFESTLDTGFVGNSGAITGVIALPSPNRDFMLSYLSWDSDDGDDPVDVGNLTVSGLGTDYTSSSYSVIVYSDADANNRTYSISVGGTTHTIDDGSTFDGLFVEGNGAAGVPATGSAENFVVFSGLTASSFSIDMASTPGRGAINAIQITTEPISDPHPVLEVDRLTGEINLINNTASSVAIKGYSITSAQGALSQSSWESIADNYDLSGNSSVDNDENWFELAAPSSKTDFSEASINGGNIASSQSIQLGSAGAWLGNPVEDLQIELLVADGTLLPTLVRFVGNNGVALSQADLNADGNVNTDDWLTLRENLNGPQLSEDLSPAELFRAGDTDGDRDVDRADFVSFKDAFIAINGAAAFAAILEVVPEPNSWMLCVCGLVLILPFMRWHGRRASVPIMLLAITFVTCRIADSTAQTVSVNMSNSGIATSTLAPGDVAGIVAVSNWNNVDISGTTVAPTALVDGTGAATTATFESTLTTSFNGDSGSGNATPDHTMMQAYISWDQVDGSNPEDEGLLEIAGLGSDFTSPGYDVYLYADADANNRTYSITVDGQTGTVVDSATYSGAFTTGTGTDDNYLLFSGLTASSFTIQMDSNAGRGAINGLQIVADDMVPDQLALEVNTATGQVTLTNPTGGALEIDYYEIKSVGNRLDPGGVSFAADFDGNGSVNGSDLLQWEGDFSSNGNSDSDGDGDSDGADFLTWQRQFGSTGGSSGGWNSLQDQDFEENGAPGNGDGWEEGDQVDASQLFEAYLTGGSTIADGARIDLGTAFLTGGAQDLTFEYHLVGQSANFIVGDVQYVNNSTAATQAVPEPSSLIMLLVSLLGIVLCAHRRAQWNRVALAKCMTVNHATKLPIFLIVIGLNSPIWAEVYNDRVYRFGEDSLEGASNGATIGSNNISPLANGASADSGALGDPTGSFLDLQQAGSPTYAEVGPGGLARPGVGGSEFGAHFDGNDDRLLGTPLNRPDEMAGPTPIGEGPLVTSYPFNYDGITSRGVQMWVYPEAAKVGAAPQTILLDSQIMGGPQISADGMWTQANSQHTTSNENNFGAVPGTVAVVGNQWHHVMQHAYNQGDLNSPVLVSGGGGTNHMSIVYVNGIAVSANGDNAPAGSIFGQEFSGNLVVGAEDDGDGGFRNHFQGVIDDLKMYVFGDNSSLGGQNYGTFELFADNDWIANEIANNVTGGELLAGDTNKDGTVNGDGTGPVGSDDVSAFVAGWLREKTILGAHSTLTVGDWETWDWGDFNHDGRVSLTDWELLSLNHPNAEALSLGELLAARHIPEPGTLTYLAILLPMSFLTTRRRAWGSARLQI